MQRAENLGCQKKNIINWFSYRRKLMKHKQETPPSNENLAENTKEPQIKEEFKANEPSIIRETNESNLQNLLQNNNRVLHQDKEVKTQSMSPNIRNNMMNFSENLSNVNMSSIFINEASNYNNTFIQNQNLMRNFWQMMQAQNFLKNVKNFLILSYLRQLSSIC